MSRGIPNPETPEYIRRERRCRYLERQNAKLQTDVTVLREENRLLKLQVGEQAQTMETLRLQIEELRRRVFGKKRDRQSDDPPNGQTPSIPDRKERTPSSYQRPKPNDADISATKSHPLIACPDCGGELAHLKRVERYVEDLLPLSDWYKALQRITKHVITIGFCKHCKKRVSAIPLAKHLVTVGENVAQFVSFATVILRLSYAQTGDFLKSVARLSLSDGEIVHLLENTAKSLTPAFTDLTKTLQTEAARHYDETSWKTPSGQGNYAWIMTSAATADTLFALGQSRGKGVAEELRGEKAETCGITDDYAAYANLFDAHQLCFAHVHRKLRDLAFSTALPEEKRIWCKTTFTAFAELYLDVRLIVGEPFCLEERVKKKADILQRLVQLASPDMRDPLALARIKTRLQEKVEQYLTCVTLSGIPPDNNTAERRLRHLVLKRKSCQGSKTPHGADTMSKLYSVLLSLWWKNKTTFFQAFTQAMQRA